MKLIVSDCLGQRENGKRHLVSEIHSMFHSHKFLFVMASSLQFILLLSSINLIETTKFLSMLNTPKSDVIIDTNKAIGLQRIGTYASKLKEEIIHSIIPLHNLCIGSPSTDICLFTSRESYPSIVEVATILSSSDIINSLPRYDINQTSNFIRNDISRILRVHRLDKYIATKNSTIHLIDDQFHATNGIKKSLLYSSRFHIEDDKPDILQISPTPSTIVFRQIANNRIGFDFLTNAELISLLIAAVSTIDKSYQVTDLSASLNLFGQLIIAQSIYILRSCSNHQEHISFSHPCLIVSTLFLRPLIENNNVFSVYRLISLPTIVNGDKYMYSNLPEAISINTDDHTIVAWNTPPKKSQCLFSIFVYCENPPPSIRLSHSPCLSELFNDSTHIAGACQVTRSPAIQPHLMNIGSNVWLFFPTEDPIYCHKHPITSEFGNIISIKEPSIVRMPCGYPIKCTHAELSPVTCINRRVMMKSTAHGKYEELTIIPCSINNMTKQIISTYELKIKNSIKDILKDLQNDKQSIMTTFQKFGEIILSILFLVFFSLILFFIRWIKHMVQKRLNKLEKDVDDLLHELA